MMPGEDYCEDDYYCLNPYDSFMKKHLQHYGYYTGRNQNYKNQFQQYSEWDKTFGYNLSTSSCDCSDSESDEEKNAESVTTQENILPQGKLCSTIEQKQKDNKLQEDSHRTTQLIYSCGESGKMVPRLREPRSLYALNKELGPQQAARWPSDLQVINERVHHIQTVPTEPEPFYKQTGLEKCPMARGETNGGRVVFSYETNSSFFMKSRAGGSKNGCDPCAVPLQFENDTTLIFESRFESGNLGKAIQVGEREYELHLRYDLYTNKHTQWFYFRVSNTQADVEYRFTIVNFMKPDSLYNDGMKPVMYSEKEAALNKVGWIRAGNDIKYYKNNLRYETSKGDRYFYSMTWTIKFKHNHDTVYFSHCYPYTYTDLQNYLLELTNDPIKSRICKQRVLCRTLAGNLVYVLSITSASQNPEDLKHKKAVVVTSRVHPGESNSSWMMKGFLDFVTSNSPDAKLLRDTFIFKVVPMLNPDGVVVGNYRCSLTGRDLNRNYKTALKDAYPSVWHTKMMIRKLLLEREVIVYCDLHGHSRRQNVFIYGCEQNQNPNKKFHERIFPSMLSRNTPEKFCYKSCKFKVQKSKEGTGRVVMWNMGIMNSYTMEATFCGSSLGKKKGFHFNQHDFEMMGFHFCDTLLDYCDPDSTKFYKTWLDVTEIHKLTVMAKIAEKGLNPEDVENLSDISTDTESSDGGSDSSISDGPPLHLPFSSSRPKKKKLKSKKDRDKVHKDETKKTSPVVSEKEDKRMRNNQVKPLQQDSSKPIKANGPKRTRSLDERTNSGIPVFVQERFEEKKQKRNEYLEALTAAYISNNIPISTDPAFVKLDCNQTKGETEISIISSGDSQTLEKNDSFVHFRYSGTTSDRPNQQPLNGLPALREQPLPSVTHPDGEAYADSTHIKSVFHDLELRRLTPKWLHDAATKLYRGGSSKRGDSPIKISRLFGRRELKTPDATSMEEMLRSQLIQQASVNPINRKHKPHLLEVSAAQQRQTDALSRDKNSPMKTGSNINDEVEESNKSSLTDSSEIVTKPPVSSYTVSTVRVTQTSTPTSSEKLEEPIAKKFAHRRREKSGRKSRKEMREEDEENDRRAQSTSDLSNPKVSQGQPIRSRSANTNHYKSTQLSTIEEIQKSLQSPRNEPSAVNTAGDIIKKLIKETNEEIHDLTNEIQEDIEDCFILKKNHQKSRSFANQKQPKETELSRAKPFKDSTGTVAVPFHATPISKIKSTSPNSTVPEQRKNSRELADDKTELPTMLSQPSVFNFSNQIKPVESMTYSSSSLSTLDPIKYITELRSDTVNNKSKENSSKSRNLQRHASFNSAATGVNKINPGRNNSNLSNYTASSSSLHMSATHKSVSPSSDDASPAVWYRQLSSINANQYSSYGHNPKGVKLNRQNLVFKNSENAELADLHVSDIKEARSTADLGETGEQTRARSARSSSRQVIETVPTKISLMICQDHQESSAQFLSHSRQGQRSSVFSRQQTRKK
ncbi:cytosolic carboxypeptidase 2-like isoform X5 [Physella acuta]|uniref:cytosolic carboxypeptidase 2-like isoform X5 n=1 Tax=Physella acuta TaxID=109671 RepID=UPI0027DC7B35|nr:cytosolic carboxypeptidase 2-like isoform X5 [Physella acuta]